MGSSSRYSVLPVSTRASSVASLMRWASPPDRVVDGWPSGRYPSPTPCRLSQDADDGREILEERGRFLDGQSQHVGDRPAPVADLQRLRIEPGARQALQVTYRSGRKFISISSQPVALAGFAPPALDVEAEAAGAVALLLGLAGVREHLADLVEHPGVGGRIAPRRAADGGLVDADHLVDLVDPAEAPVRPGLGGHAAQPPGQGPGQRLVHQGTLARTAHARHADQHPQRKPDIDGLQVVGRHALQHQGPRLGHAAGGAGSGICSVPLR